MGRTASYDVNDVLRRAAALFRERGFHSTSVQDIVDATGINRFAIYEKFGGKEELFYATLEFYVEVPVKKDLLAPLCAESPSFDSLLGVLKRMRAVNLDQEQPAGCLIINARIEMAGKDPKVELIVEGFSEAFREATARVLHHATARGEVKTDRPIEHRADYLVTMVNAFMVVAHMSRSSADKLMLILLDDVHGWRAPRASDEVQGAFQ